MEIPFYEQENYWTCGPACLRMVLGSMGIKRTEGQLARFLWTTKKGGTRQKEFSRVAEKYKLNYVVMRDVSIDALVDASDDDFRIITCYHLPDEDIDHYSVFKKAGSKYIYFLDPWFGPEHKYEKKYFKDIWIIKQEKESHWFIGFKK